MTTIKRFIVLVLLGAAFLGGYYLGRKPGSPDIFRYADDVYRQAGQAGRKLTAARGDGRAEDTPVAAKKFAVRLGGRTVEIGGPTRDR